jgi:preprotein translocase subunit SecB
MKRKSRFQMLLMQHHFSNNLVRIFVKTESIINFLKNIKINELHIKKYRFQRRDLIPTSGTVNIAFNFSAKEVELSLKDTCLGILLPLEFQLREAQEGELVEDDLFKLEITYQITFTISENAITSVDTIPVEFKKSYIQKLVHPYFRKEITDSLQRAGLPPIMIPLYENI